jgi:hypothetical protein
LKPGKGVAELYQRVRGLTPPIPPLGEDRPPAPDLERLARSVAQGKLDPGEGGA